MSKACLNCPENKTFLYKNINYFPEVGCKGNEYIDKATGLSYYWDGNEYIQLPCCDIPVVTQDTGTIDMEGDGSAEDPLRAFVKVSEEEGNILEVNIDGLFVPAGADPFTLNTQDTATVDLEGDGTIGTPLTAEVILSDDFNQDIEERANGLYAPGFYIEATKAELDAYILAGTLEEGATYKVTGVDTALYSGTTIYIKAIETNILNISGIGEFYNPKYDTYPIWERYSTITITAQSNIFTLGETITANNGATATIHDDARGLIIPLTGDWSTATSITGNTSTRTATVSGFVANPGYSIGDYVIWGGKVWLNLTGNIGTSVDVFTLDAVNWIDIPYGGAYYNLTYDEIKYDYENDAIIYRKDKDNNIVSSSYDYNTNYLGNSPIRGFKWGVGLNGTTTFISGNIVTNSYFEVINHKTNYIIDNILESYSNYYNNYCTEDSNLESNRFTQFNITNCSFNSCGIYVNTFVAGWLSDDCYYNVIYQYNNFSGNSYSQNNRIYGVNFEKNIFANESTCTNNFRNCRIRKNSFVNQSYVNGNAFTGTTDFGSHGISFNSCNYGGFYQNRQFIAGVGTLSFNILNNGQISSNILDYSAEISNNNLVAASGISNNNLTPLDGSFGGIIQYNFLTFSNIGSNSGALEIYRNSLSSFSAISNNSVQAGGFLEINHNTLVSEAGITNNIASAAAGAASIRYNYLKTAGIGYCDINASIYIRQCHIEDESFNDRLPTRIQLTESISDTYISPNETILNIQKNVTGAAGAGAVGALNIQTYVIPTNYFIEEVWVDFRSGITFGVGSAINLGLEVDGVTSGLDNTSGDMATLNGTITRITKTSAFVPATGNRLLVMSVTGNPIGPGSIFIRVKLRNLKRISFP